jgi:hypothetical protein
MRCLTLVVFALLIAIAQVDFAIAKPVHVMVPAAPVTN